MFEQVALSYGFDGLEPVIDSQTVEIHYTKHYKTYTDNFNDLVAKAPEFDGKSVEYILTHLDLAPPHLRQGLINQGGGYYNHTLYFDSLGPNPQRPQGELAEKIAGAFGDYDSMLERLAQASIGRFGSGYGWLAMDAKGNLCITASPNQDSPIMSGKTFGLLPVDVWEHAYYLKYKNLRADYVKALFSIVDWSRVEARCTAISGQSFRFLT